MAALAAHKSNDQLRSLAAILYGKGSCVVLSTAVCPGAEIFSGYHTHPSHGTAEQSRCASAE